MRILQISSAESLGGGERHLSDLANGLVARGHELYAAVRPQSLLRAELRNVPAKNICELRLRNSLDVNSARELARLVKTHQIEILHAHMARDYPLALYAAAANPRTRLVFTRHVLFPLNRLHRLTFRKAAAIIAVSEAVGVQLKAERVAPPEKIHVVSNGINTSRFVDARTTFDRNDFLRSWQLPEGALLVGMVGELTPLKGQEEFLHAAAAISKRIAHCYFVVAGIDHSPDQRNQKRIAALIDELNLNERVRRVSWLDDLAQLYCALDVFVSASRTESFGLAIVEAMASRTAVVATDTAGACEIIRPGKTGLITTIGDPHELTAAVESLLINSDLKESLAAAAQSDATQRFDLKRMVDETENIYASVL